MLATDDPTNEIGAAWGCKESLRQLLDSPADRAEIRKRLWRFYDACEVDGLQVSLAGAQAKLTQIDRRPQHSTPLTLGPTRTTTPQQQ